LICINVGATIPTMTSERQKHRRAVRNWEKTITHVEQKLEGSKVEASDFVGGRPSFEPSQTYLGRVILHASHIQAKLNRGGLSDRKQANLKDHLLHLLAILQEGKTRSTRVSN